MLKRKALRKILITTISCFILFIITTLGSKFETNYLDSDYEVVYTSSVVNHEIYLLGENNYLVKFNIFLNDDTIENKIKKIISYLTQDTNEKVPTGLLGIIPKDTKLLSIKFNGKIAVLNFSNTFLNVSKEHEERLIEAIIYSIVSLDEIEGITIQIDGNNLNKLPQNNIILTMPLNKDFGINKVYDITNRNGIQKVVLYYLDKISNNNYYVPVTKYVNDSRDKIKIILENLSGSYVYEENLISYLNSKTTLLDYYYDDDIFVIDLNKDVFKNDVLLEEVEYTLSNSIFDSYNVNKISLKIDGVLFKEYKK